ncbi:hypothetical protein Bcav_0581 [Beutenbergia cavernae DSM 12333]|uniref:DUF2877 domain-containing protein n=1 Tax=Beutenbergia cavernae (strain ATCC BAA-8 / DSM 12333 / CCUG 43141 / JCM 11478 / NBRC 16432 / NCIMB 13614 / HKI 0122) TaxID=471853 RepID=C5BXV0_BEUC1|nr:DUF2877 domain-containing protein [Beutenbergia cavernae]ACQ78844.1 hypothetical protein Bcav_0581 [Beutenbergia cavernae DSM 12333]
MTARWIGATASEVLQAVRVLDVHSVFDTSVNLAAPTTREPALVHVSLVRGVRLLECPFGIELETPEWTAWSRAVHSGRTRWHVDARTGALTADDAAVSLELGAAWRGAWVDVVAPPRPDSLDLAPPTDDLIGASGLATVAPDVLRRRLRDAVAGLARGDAGAAAWLVGRGPGLTPSGDDALVGAVGALHARRLPDRAADGVRALAELVATRGSALTTDVSCAYLRDACRGRFAGPLRRALAARPGVVGSAAIRDLLAVGHTSGADTLLGIAAVRDALAPRPSLVGAAS